MGPELTVNLIYSFYMRLWPERGIELEMPAGSVRTLPSITNHFNNITRLWGSNMHERAVRDGYPSNRHVVLTLMNTNMRWSISTPFLHNGVSPNMVKEELLTPYL